MSTIGIVGCEAAKFTPETELRAREVIRNLISRFDKVVSGKCHLGGIDIWAIEEAVKAGKEWEEFPPKTYNWEGYSARNIQIADASHTVVCLTIKILPDTYTGMRFDYCYHCKTDTHIKSGGCWTVKQAKKFGRIGYVLTVD